ncbi:hypothetical protein [Nocardia fluminea]|uniref:hypothetical protein n=1 Tax=Nocardia fluminea TaxID=134984 RepID=UPI003D09848E
MDTTGNSTEPTGIAGWAVQLMEQLGGFGAGLAIALENLFPPLPSEVILPLAGFTASRGRFGLAEVLLWTTLGSVVGVLALYGLGAALGRDRLRRIVDRVGLSNAAICGQLYVTRSAVEKHINAIFTKLDLPVGEAHNRRVLAILQHLRVGAVQD